MAYSDSGTLGLPPGLPSEDYLQLGDWGEVGEPGQSNNAGVSGAYALSPLVRWINKELTHHEPKVQAWREKAKECYRFKAGKQLSDIDQRLLDQAGRPAVAFNSVQKYINFVGGVQRMTPQALLFLASSVEDEQSSIKGELLTKIYEWVMRQSEGHSERSRAFDDMNTGGMGWCGAHVSRNDDPRGLIKYQWDDSFEMLWPESSRQNLEGVKWIGRECFLPEEEALARWPQFALLIRAAAGTSDEDAQFPQVPTGRLIKYVVPYIQTEPLNIAGGPGRSGKPGKVKILEWQYYEDVPGYYFFDPLEKTDTWLSNKDFRIYRDRLNKPIFGNLRITDYDSQSHRVYKQTFLLQRRIMLQAPIKLASESFTYLCMTAHWDHEGKIWYGIMRVLMDPQRWGNKFLNQVVEIMGTQGKGGYDAEVDAATPGQRKDIENNSAKPGAVNIWNVGAISGGKVKPKEIPQIPQGSLAVLQYCFKSFDDVSGIATQMFGMAVGGGTPGVTLRRQMLAGLLVLAAEFESLSRFRKKEGRVIYGLMKVIADNRFIRIGGAFDAQAMQMDPKLFDDVLPPDIELDEVEHDPTMRQMYADFVMQIMPILIRTNHFLPELLDYMPLPVQIRQKLKQAIVQQAQQMQQMQMMGLTPGRGKPRGIEEMQADIHKVRAQGDLAAAKARNLEGARRRDDLRAIFDGVNESRQQMIEKQRLALDAMKTGHELAMNKHNSLFDQLLQTAEFLRPTPEKTTG